MIKRAYNKVFIGFIFVFFHFKLNGFDLLPDFVGYLLAAGGLAALSVYAPVFSRARLAAFALACVEGFGLVCTLLHVWEDTGSWFDWAFTLASAAGALTLFLFMGKGMAEMLEQAQRATDAKNTAYVFGGKLAYTLLNAALFFPPLRAVMQLAPVSVGMIALGVLVNLLVLLLLYRGAAVLQKAADIRAAQERMPTEPFSQNETGGQEL